MNICTTTCYDFWAAAIISSLKMMVLGWFCLWVARWALKSWARLKVKLQILQKLTFKWMLPKCFWRWLFWVNFFKHEGTGHEKDFPLWSFLCFDSEDELENFLPHGSHWYARAFVWVFRWSFKFDDRLKVLSQISQVNLLRSGAGECFEACWSKFPFVENFRPHTLQTNDLIFKCIIRWFLRLVAQLKVLSHSEHLNFLMLSWIF